MVTVDGCGTTLTTDNDGCQNNTRQCWPHFAAHVKWITLYNDMFRLFPEFIITPSLVVKLSTTTTANDDGSGV